MAGSDDEIETIIDRLSTLASEEEKPPAMVVVAPDMGDPILGNRGGFLHLAIASLQAARGQEQKFKDADWVYHDDADWWIQGLKPDPLAHVYIPEKQTRFQQIRGQMLGYALLFAIVGLFGAGLISVAGWIDQLWRWILLKWHG